MAAPTGTEIGIVELISLGYTALRAADGHLIVLPNSVAASQVTINLNTTFAAAPIAVSIRLSRDADVEASRKLALEVSAALVGEKRLAGCYATKVDGTGATMDLRLSAPDFNGRETLHSTLLVNLSKRFAAENSAVAPADSPAFS